MKSNSFLGLRTTIYRVSDLDIAKKWYEKILGFAPYFDEPFYVGFNVGGYELGLQPMENNTQTPNQTVQTYWGVEDVHATYQMLLDNGATTHEEPTDVGGDIVVALVKDPWGNVLGIIKNPHFGK